MPDCRLARCRGRSAQIAPQPVGGPAKDSTGVSPYERIVVMLVLSRKKNESIVINNDITIVVVEIRGDKVRLGVEAPKEVPVHRREVYDAIKRNAAVQSGAPDRGRPIPIRPLRRSPLCAATIHAFAPACCSPTSPPHAPTRIAAHGSHCSQLRRLLAPTACCSEPHLTVSAPGHYTAASCTAELGPLAHCGPIV